jgi:hypothetical protein
MSVLDEFADAIDRNDLPRIESLLANGLVDANARLRRKAFYRLASNTTTLSVCYCVSVRASTMLTLVDSLLVMLLLATTPTPSRSFSRTNRISHSSATVDSLRLNIHFSMSISDAR